MKFNNSIKSQQSRLLDWLQQKPITTFEARLYLDIVAPAPRIFELRNELGLNIQTFTTDGINPGTKERHRVARYVLLPGQYLKHSKIKKQKTASL